MIKLLILSLLIQINIYSQGEHVVIQKEIKTSFFPNIAGISFGEMNYSLIWNEIKVNGNSNYTVDGFKIQYGQKESDVKGSVIPDSICKEIIRCCSFNGMIFITNITGIDKYGKRIIICPLNLTLTRND